MKNNYSAAELRGFLALVALVSATMCLATGLLSKSIFLRDLILHPYVYIFLLKLLL